MDWTSEIQNDSNVCVQDTVTTWYAAVDFTVFDVSDVQEDYTASFEADAEEGDEPMKCRMEIFSSMADDDGDSDAEEMAATAALIGQYEFEVA